MIDKTLYLRKYQITMYLELPAKHPVYSFQAHLFDSGQLSITKQSQYAVGEGDHVEKTIVAYALFENI